MILCALRWLMRNIGMRRPFISGHDYQQMLPDTGQPFCVDVLKCRSCGKLDVSWRICRKCGFGTTEATK